jgi:hypothetical protein
MLFWSPCTRVSTAFKSFRLSFSPRWWSIWLELLTKSLYCWIFKTCSDLFKICCGYILFWFKYGSVSLCTHFSRAFKIS